MSRILSGKGVQNALFILSVLLMLLGLLLFPSQSVSAAKDGVSLCLNVIVPSLFPFFVLSALCVELGLLEGLGRLLGKIMVPLFRVSGNCAGAYLLGIVGGYPVGARTAIALYERGQCSKTEAERLLSFCNNSGPAFILGVVGAGIFSSSTVGLWLYGAHVLASLLVGLIFRFYGKDSPGRAPEAVPRKPQAEFSAAFTGAVKSGLDSALGISGFVIFFTVLIRLLYLTGIMGKAAALLGFLLRGVGIGPGAAESLLAGLIEMTSGVWSLRDAAVALADRLKMAAFILGWAGLCVHCQVLSFIGASGLSPKTYFFGKLLHGVFSFALIAVLSKLLGWSRPVSAYLAGEVITLAGLRFFPTLLLSGGFALGFWAIVSIRMWKKGQKICGKQATNHV